MKYPEFLKKGNTIGICAPSAGIWPDDVEYEASINRFHSEGYSVKETASVHNAQNESASPEVRGAEFNQLIADKAYLEEVMKKGADEAAYYARKTLSKVKRKLGFVQ
jgi:muramoyltetrapeptide carboxypeptidase LdcA involved in peptidoglycan recycling